MIMSSVIYCFTSTGNSLQIAKIISKEIDYCNIKMITSLPEYKPVGGSSKIIGFTFPVFNFGLPRLVKKFIEELTIMPNTYCFAFICYGGYSADTLGMLKDILAKKKINLSYTGEVRMPASNASARNPEKIMHIINTSTAKVEKAAKDIANMIILPTKRRTKWLTNIANSLLYKNIDKYDKKFMATDRCTSCGLCVKLCPVYNIKLEIQKPIWLHKCERCLRCFQWCPYEAIQYGEKTVKWEKYQNPCIKVKEIIGC